MTDPAKWLECQTERAHIQRRPLSGQTIHFTFRTVEFRFDYWRRRCNTALRVESWWRWPAYVWRRTRALIYAR